MANLANYQKLTWVLPSQPFGSGADGAYSSATIPTLTKDSCSGTAASTTLTTSASTFANGDVLLIQQMRGTGVGNYEFAKVSSGGGTASLTLTKALQFTYTDSGASQAQAVKIPQYSTGTVQSGTWTLTAWDKNISGILPIAIKGTLTVTGTVNATAKGFTGADAASSGQSQTGTQGEGTSGAGDIRTQTANGNSGGGGLGGGTGSPLAGGGAGGGNGAAGSNGVAGSVAGGIGGTTFGAADLTTMTLGGSGGSGGQDDNNVGSTGAGAAGGGMILFITKNLVVTGGVNANGATGSSSTVAGHGGGGGGAGGSILIQCQNATLGSNLITATAGGGGAGNGGSGAGGAGGAGRIAIHHSGTITGTTNPTFTDVTDGTLMEAGGSFIFNLL